jgi:hypothetical protein
MSHADRRRARLKDFAIYIAISSAVILFLVVCALNGVSYEWIIAWIETSFIFVSIVIVSRRQWSITFWLFFATAFALHIICLSSIVAYLHRMPHAAARLVSVGGLVEYAVLLITKNLLFPSKRFIE